MSTATLLLLEGLMVLSLFGIFSISLALRRSVEGWEDDLGFHAWGSADEFQSA